MIDIDRTKFVYLGLYGHEELLDVIQSKLLLLGFDKKQIVNRSTSKGVEGDYIAQLMTPDKPIQLHLNRIIKVETKSPQKEGMHQSAWMAQELVCVIELFDKPKPES